MLQLTKLQFLVLLALNDEPKSPTAVRATIRQLTDYRLQIKTQTTHAAIRKMLKNGLAEICEKPLYNWQSSRHGQIYEITARGQWELEKELIFYRALVRKTRPRVIY